jgi:hypothetical protein
MTLTSRRIRPFALQMMALIGLVAAGCSTSSLTPLSSSPQLVQEPALGEQRTAEVGDTLVSTTRLVRIAAIHIADGIDEHTKIMHLPAHLTIRSGMFLARYQHGAETCYVPPEPAVLDGEKVEAVVCVPPTGDPKVVTRDNPDEPFPLSGPIRFERTTVVDHTAPAFQQELVYNGRAGSVVKFLYREFISEAARPAFSQDVQYDLNEGKTIGFKSARVEIIDATNTSITYRVLAHFPAPPI